MSEKLTGHLGQMDSATERWHGYLVSDKEIKESRLPIVFLPTVGNWLSSGFVGGMIEALSISGALHIQRDKKYLLVGKPATTSLREKLCAEHDIVFDFEKASYIRLCIGRKDDWVWFTRADGSPRCLLPTWECSLPYPKEARKIATSAEIQQILNEFWGFCSVPRKEVVETGQISTSLASCVLPALTDMLCAGIMDIDCRDTISFCEGEALKHWREVMNGLRFPNAREDDKIDGELVSRIRDLTRIWKQGLEVLPLRPVWTEDMLEVAAVDELYAEKLITETREIADMLGISAQLSLWKSGVPASDILA